MFAAMSTSGVPTAASADVCANCGQEGHDVKLKNCTACLLVKYCSVDCQKAHRKIHKKTCKKRSAELKDDRLYSQGHERPDAEFCPICTQPVPIPTGRHSFINPCCMKMVCNGCGYAAMKMGIDDKCPFCRAPDPKDDAETLALVQARVDKKDPEGIRFLADQYMQGSQGLEKDMSRAVELYIEAAELGSVGACNELGVAYHGGLGVEQDVSRSIHFYEKAAMLGHSMARHNLGSYECDRENYDRGVRHFLISAKMGFTSSLEGMKTLFTRGLATESQYAEALKGYQDAVEEMKSPEREKAEKMLIDFESEKSS